MHVPCGASPTLNFILAKSSFWSHIVLTFPAYSTTNVTLLSLPHTTYHGQSRAALTKRKVKSPEKEEGSQGRKGGMLSRL